MSTTTKQLARLATTAFCPMTAKYAAQVAEGGENLYSFGADELVPSASMIKTLLAWASTRLVTDRRLSFEDNLVLDSALEAAGDGILRLFRSHSTVRFGDALKLSIVVSDNWATNLVIRHLGGPEKINELLGQNGFDSRLIKFLSNRQPDETLEWTQSTDWNRGVWGIGAVSLLDHERALRETLASDSPLVEAFRLQQDKRSLARGIEDGAPLFWKTGSVYGLRHADGILSDTAGSDIAVGAFTDSLSANEYVDHPACIAIGRFTNWALQVLGRDECLAVIEPIPSLTFEAIDPANLNFVESVLDREDVSRTLRSTQSERQFWNKAARGERWGSVAVVDGRPIGMVGLYASAGSSPDIGVYLGDPKDRGRGFGKEMARFAINTARARGATSVGWSCSKQNVQSVGLAQSLGFTFVGTVVGGRASASSVDDELAFRLELPSSLPGGQTGG